jgi:hypothetical protein
MFGQCILLGTSIGAVSTGIYATFTNDESDMRSRRSEYLSIYSIIFVVSCLILYLFHGRSESLVMGNVAVSQQSGGKPPF